MNHYKYLGVLKPTSDDIIIDCRYFNNDHIKIKVPQTKWHVMAALNNDNTKSMICIHNDKFGVKDKMTKIGDKYFRLEGTITSVEYFKGRIIADFFREEMDKGNNLCDIGYILHESKQFATVYAPNGYCKGLIYQYTNNDGEITAIEIRFYDNIKY